VQFGFDQADLVDSGDETQAAPATAASAPAGAAAELVYRSLHLFVAELLLPTYRRKVDGRSLTWCPRWEQHPEAVVRLEALWRSWEHLRLDPALGISVWLRDHLDHHYPILLDPHGPFRGCSLTRGHLTSYRTELD
jgi:hypothetical protein